MVIAVDFDGTVVPMDRPYEDVATPLVLKPGARQALRALKQAGHTLLLWSARASPALIRDPELDPLVRAGLRSVDRRAWLEVLPVNVARYRQMLDFVAVELHGVFDAVDDGTTGKPVGVDLFIDDKALRLGRGTGGFAWRAIAAMYGEPARERGERRPA